MRRMIRKPALCLLICCAAVLFALCTVKTVYAAVDSPVLVVDAGHGGEDGGAVGADGTAESGVNLQIARRLELLLLFLGHKTAMTREGEAAVYSEDAVTLRQKKVSDLHNRAEMINGYESALVISIHQNSLPGHPKVHGAQVFYNAAAQAERLAAAVQEALNRCLQAGDERQVKAAPGSIFLLAQAKHPTILAECGFMSCPEECRRLQEPDYQVCLALVIASGVEQFLFEGYGGTA